MPAPSSSDLRQRVLGLVVAITYDGYGNITNETNSANGGNYKAFGYRVDGETGWLRPDPSTGRYYGLFVGRWLQNDPIGFAGGDVNLYRYVWNRSLTLVDFLGLWAPGLSLALAESAGATSGGTAAGAGASLTVGGFVILAPIVAVAGYQAGRTVNEVTGLEHVLVADAIKKLPPVVGKGSPPRPRRYRAPCYGQRVPSNDTLRRNAMRLHAALNLTPRNRCLVVVATASICLRTSFTRGIRRSVYASSSSETSPAQRRLGRDLDYFRVFGVANMGPDRDQTHAEQMILNYAERVAHLRYDVDTPIAPYPLAACGPAGNNCAQRIADTPGVRLLNPL